MIKRILYMAASAAVLALAAVSCLDGPGMQPEPAVPDGYVAVSFRTDIPAMQEVLTKAVDPDGDGIQNMTLFCFDSYGLFISTVSAEINPSFQTEGSFTANIPENTGIIHFVANQIMTNFAEDSFRGRSEAEVMALLEGSSGRMIYWSRFAATGGQGDIASQLAASDPIHLIRNHAMFSVEVGESAAGTAVDFIVEGFAVCNTNAFGTVAPYHPELGFDFIWPGEDFVTLPVDGAKLSDIMDVTDAENQYVFETENRADDPVSVIIKGGASGETSQYYRVLLITEDGDQIMVRRNHHYILNIVGELANGQPTFAEALSGPATNNVWISISEDVNEVRNGEWILSVEQTSYVLDESYSQTSFTVNYTLSRVDGSEIVATDAADVSVTGSDGMDVRFRADFDLGQDSGTGHVTFSLDPLGTDEQMHEYDVLVRKGKLQRTVKVILIRTQHFTPAWVGTQVYGEVNTATGSRANVTAMFTIPETCPAELFPLNVYISTENLDVRSGTESMTVVIQGSEDWFGEDNGTGYKYVYVADGPGIHSVYFENILNRGQDDSGTMTFEAECFETMQKTYTFAEHQRTITVDGLNGEADGSGMVSTRMVPQKRSANVQFDMVMMNLEGSWPDYEPEPINVEANDEFLIYTQNLDYYEDGDESLAGVREFDCTFHPVDESVWQAGGRMMMFMPRHHDNPSAGTGRYSIYMKTNKARSAEIVRIASNQHGSPSVLNPEEEYEGYSYRSVIFELDNYHPFRFAATVNGQGTQVSGEAEEAVDELTLSYEPNQQVDLSFDVTSFSALDAEGANESVDPFGEEFEIYIEAPMLSIDGSRLASYNLNSDKLRADPSVPGRFIYTVDSSREAERSFGYGTVVNQDNTGADQQGERKTLPFVTNTPVSAGDIVISSNEDKVVFYSKTFSVVNESITGSMQYRDASGSLHPVSVNAFVPFELSRNGSRIGSVNIVSDGSYELRLRKEYEFNWYTDAVQLSYDADDGVRYTAVYQNLAALFVDSDIVLVPETISGE